MRRLGILFVLTSPVRGGVEEVVLSLIQRLDPSDFAPALAAPRPLLDALAPDLARVRVETLAVEAESWLRRSEVEQLGRFMRRLRPDIVNPHLFRSTAVAAPLARWNGVPAVVETYHGREGWRQGALRGTFLPDRLVCRFLDRVVAVSEAARAFLIRGKGYPASKIVVVPNGRDLSAFRPGACRDEMRKELGLDRQVPVVGVVGRLEAQKGHAYLLDAWPEVTRAFPDARLLVVGEGSLREALERHARRLAITSSVVFVGFRSDIPRVLDCIDILALPSLYEGMPLTAIEASAMARPVVATSVDGTPEVIRHNVTGKLVPAGNARALAIALLGLLRDRDGARQMGQAGRDYALNRFDLHTQVEATARVYRSVAGVERRLAA